MPEGLGLLSQSAYGNTSKRTQGLGLIDSMVSPPEQQYREFSPLPINATTYIAHLFGLGSPPKASDLTNGEMDAIKRAVATSMQKTGLPSGSFGYGQYTGGARTSGSRFDENGTIGNLLLKSFMDPTFRAETLLGQARYRVDDNGNVIVSDTYNFNTPRSEMNQYVQREGASQVVQDLFNLFKNGRSNEVLETLVNMFGPSKEEGRSYSLNLGKLKR